MKVPFMDLKRQYLSIKEEIDGAIQNTIDGCAFVSGSKVKKFEKDFAAYCGVEHAIGVSSGTSALYVGLRALGIKKGDIVITVPFTFIATLEAITLTGATPVLIDIEKDSYTISTKMLKEYIEESCDWNAKDKKLIDKNMHLIVRAIMPVHLYGQMADMDEIMKIAEQYDLIVLEDAAQVHGATYKNKKAGTIGHAGAFSFYPSKNLGAYGQGGAVITNNADLAEKVRMFIDHGSGKKYYHTFEGWNFKMDGFQAAVLDVKLKHLDNWNSARQSHAHTYNELLKDVADVIAPNKMVDREHIYHLYVIRVKGRDSLQNHLKNTGVGSLIHYPISVHLQDAYRYLGHKTGDFPNAEECADTVLSLPMFPELTYEEIEYVCEKIQQWSRVE
ncbi:MAG: DegT/DnrJ/EryC1/StrS family aminotransferase [bacterium]